MTISIAQSILQAKASELQALAAGIGRTFSVQQESELGLVNATTGDIMEMLLSWAQDVVEGTKA